MIEYLIKSGVVLIILLAVYHLWLEREKMHKFNRIFLLASLCFGLTIPLLSFKFPSSPVKAIEIPDINNIITQPLADTISVVNPGSSRQKFLYAPFILVYGTVAFYLLLQFTINLFKITSKATNNPHERTREGIIVLLKEKVVPHSFLSYTFLNEEDYRNNSIEHEVITHEFAHIRQKHSIDLLLIELLKIVFWFNPVFWSYRRAIQLNHEFLADEAVIRSKYDVSAYQHLLLQKASLKTVGLASNLNYSITKLRFQMMKKQTSTTRKMVKGLALIPVATMLVISFSDQIFAQGASATSELKIDLNTSAQLSKDEYYKGAYMRFVNKNGTTIRKRYEELTAAEKSTYPAPVKPTEELMSQWKDATKFMVLVGYEKPNKLLSNYRADDFVSYYSTKSETDVITYIFLIDRDFLEKIKKLGGDFNKVGDQVFLAPPPPVVIPAKQ